MGRRRAKKGRCTYCGRWAAGSMDHVPPKAFFAHKRPIASTVTVFSCEECRLPTGKDDEYAAAMMALRQEAGENPDAVERRKRFLLWLQKDEAKGFRRAFLDQTWELPARTPAGLHVGRVGMFEANLERIVEGVIVRTIRGLWRHHHGDILPPDATVAAFAEDWLVGLDDDGLESVAGIVRPLSKLPYTPIGDGTTFRYRFQVTPGVPEGSGWMLEFYESTRFIGVTLPPGLDPRAGQEP